MKKFLTEFKEFAVRGNVIDMAVGIVIGGAFSKIVTALVNMVMSVVGLFTSAVNLSELAVTLQRARRRSALLFPALRRFSAERAGIHHSGAVRVLRAEGHQPLQAQESGRGRGGCRSGGALQRRNAPG